MIDDEDLTTVPPLPTNLQVQLTTILEWGEILAIKENGSVSYSIIVKTKRSTSSIVKQLTEAKYGGGWRVARWEAFHSNKDNILLFHYSNRIETCKKYCRRGMCLLFLLMVLTVVGLLIWKYATAH